MRKATSGLSMRGSRKKQPPSNAPPNGADVKEDQQQRPHAPPAQFPEQHPPPEVTRHHHRRKASNDEIATLTSKNYRLAKELSELRVRHREECKSVTRLTMENMNLASRCREAISHVAMLKKELEMNQKRSAEALAMQREQTQRIAENLSTEMSRLSHSGSEDSGDRSTIDLERIMSPARLPPRSKEEPRSAERGSSRHSRTVGNPRSPEPDEDDTVGSSPASKETENTQPNEVPKVYSTPNRHRNPDRWKPKIDQNADSPGIFPSSASPKVVAGKPHNYNEEFPAEMTDPHTQNQSKKPTDRDDGITESYSSRSGSSNSSYSSSSKSSLHGRSIIGMNSIDAFEASFDTKFPSDFASREESERKGRSGTPHATEIYNPFSPSPARSVENNDVRTINRLPASPNASPIHPTLASSPNVIRTARVSDSGVFGNPVTPEEKKSSDASWNSDAYSTPPKEVRSVSTNAGSEPKRPEKAASAAARARYEKAMQPRTSAVQNSNHSAKTEKETKISVDTKPDSTHERGFSFLKGSPSALLKRIQQRRHSKQSTKEQTSPESLSDNDKDSPSPQHERQQSDPAAVRNSPSATQGAKVRDPQLRRNTEMPATSANGSERPFDEMEDGSAMYAKEKQFDAASPGRAQSISERLNAIKGRRSVQQPVSYAEPALNTKLRRGDEFFPKGDGRSPIAPGQVSHAGPVAG